MMIYCGGAETHVVRVVGIVVEVILESGIGHRADIVVLHFHLHRAGVVLVYEVEAVTDVRPAAAVIAY